MLEVMRSLAIEALEAEVGDKVSTAQFQALVDEVALKAYTSYVNDQLALKTDLTDHNVLVGRVTVAEGEIDSLEVVTQNAWDDLRFPASGLGVSETPAPWVQPTGAIDAYAISELVTHDNPNDSSNIWVYESTIDANTTEPGRDGLLDRWWTPISLASEYAGTGNAPQLDPELGTRVFENAKTQSVGGLAQMPHAWAEGTEIRPHVHWIQPAAGNVVWQLEYRVMPAVGGVFPGAWVSVSSETGVSTYPGSGDWVQITAFPAIDMTGFGLSSMVLFRLSRVGGDALDTLAADVHLLEFDIHHLVDRFGSVSEFSKDGT